MTPPCDECASKQMCIPSLLSPGQGRSEESPGWRSCRVDAGDGGSLVSAFLLAIVLAVIAGDPLWSLFPDFTRRAKYV
jgi:hypothetical protein